MTAKVCITLVMLMLARGIHGLPSPSPVVARDDPTASATALPQPFDSSLGNNFTATSCPAFFSTFLDDMTFQACLPFSLLLQSSGNFFTASRSLVRISQIMDATCNVNYPVCSSLMSSLANQIRQTSNCGQDLQYRNPLVSQAYNGFLAYDSLYQAGCLKSSTGSYCYGDAMTNLTDPASSYIYYLPLGVQLPNSTRPACNECVQNTMAVFASGASNASKPLSKDYLAAAQIVNSNCGPRFADTNIQVSAGHRFRTRWMQSACLLVLYLLISI